MSRFSWPRILPIRAAGCPSFGSTPGSWQYSIALELAANNNVMATQETMNEQRKRSSPWTVFLGFLRLGLWLRTKHQLIRLSGRRNLVGL